MKTIIRNTATVFFILIMTFEFSCKKSANDSSDCPNCPSTTTVTPSSAHGGDTITISGKNFADSPLNEAVKINGKIINPDSVILSSATQIIAIVPIGCGSGKVTVDLDAELTNTGTPPDFTYLYQAVVTTFAGRWDNAIHTPNFNTNTPIDTTFFNGPELIHIVDDVIYLTDNNMNVITKISNFSESIDIGINIDNTPIDFFSSGNKVYYMESGFDNLLLKYFYQLQDISLGYPQLLLDTTSLSGQWYFSAVTMDTGGHIYILNNVFRPLTNLTDSAVILKSTDATASSFTPFYQEIGESLSKLKFKDGYLYMLNSNDNKIYKVSASTGTIAGTFILDISFNANAISDYTIDSNGRIYFVSGNYNNLYYFSSHSAVVTLAGNSTTGHADGIGQEASFSRPDGIDIDSHGRLFIIDKDNSCIREVNLQ